MKVILAKTAGFCMGVRRAMNAVIEATHRPPGDTYTLGPLVHNTQAIEMLAARNVRVVSDPSEVEHGTLFIRAHGVTPEVKSACRKPGVTMCDMTCPHVRRAQNIIKRHAQQGGSAIIVGDQNHAEVIGLMGHADGRGHVVSSTEEVQRLPTLDRPCLVAQTTQNPKRFHEIAKAVSRRFPQAAVHNTICSATDDRQNEVRELAARVDAMVVVGGQHSANTVRLAQIAKSQNKPTFHIETAEELSPEMIRDFKSIGVTAGASTPHWVFRAVVDRLHNIHQVRSFWRKVLYLPLRIAVHTYIFLGVGSAAMTYAASDYLNPTPKVSKVVYVLISFLYVVSMHIVNRFTDKKAAEINDPFRMRLFRRLSPMLLAFSIMAMICTLVLAERIDFVAVVLMALSLFAGLGYNLTILPGRLGKILGIHKLKEIPGSRELGPAVAWATVTVALPFLATDSNEVFDGLERAIPAFLFVFLLVFTRFLAFDQKDLEGDRLVGNETLPLILGKRKTGWVIILSLLGLVVMATIHAYLGEDIAITVPLFITVLYASVLTWLHHRRSFRSHGIGFELAVDAQFIILGLLLWIF